MTAEYIAEQSKIFGRGSTLSSLNEYQEAMNSAANELCLSNPNLLLNQQMLVEQARMKVNDDGYQYKKGKSRSKKFIDSTSLPPKRRKISQEFRLKRISELQERVKDLNDQIRSKEKRREAASNIRNYKECDLLTERISELKSDQFQLEAELAALTKQQKRSSAYYRKRQISV